MEAATLQRDLVELAAQLGGGREFEVSSAVEDLPEGPTFTARIKLDEEAEPLASQLAMWAERFNTEAALEVMFVVPPEYPAVPPIVRLLHPVLRPGTGGVMNGNLLLPELAPEGWDPEHSVVDIIRWVRTAVPARGGEIDLSVFAMYNAQAFAATRRLLLERPSNLWEWPGKPFMRHYAVYSATFALEVMGLDLPDGFVAGNKVLMPEAALMTLTPEIADGRGGGSGDAALDRLMRGWAATGDGDGDGDDAESEAMVFQLVSVLRYPVYVGVAQFTCPHGDAIIVPDPVLDTLGVPDGAMVEMTRVRLPRATSVTLQPETNNFAAAEAFTGKEPREFLEASLVRYACLQTGAVIECDGGPDVLGVTPFRFNVVEVQPEVAPAAALWAAFGSHLPISFLPAMDEYAVPPKRAADAPRADGSLPVGVYRPVPAASTVTPLIAAPAAPAAAASGGAGAGGGAGGGAGVPVDGGGRGMAFGGPARPAPGARAPVPPAAATAGVDRTRTRATAPLAFYTPATAATAAPAAAPAAAVAAPAAAPAAAAAVAAAPAALAAPAAASRGAAGVSAAAMPAALPAGVAPTLWAGPSWSAPLWPATSWPAPAPAPAPAAAPLPVTAPAPLPVAAPAPLPAAVPALAASPLSATGSLVRGVPVYPDTMLQGLPAATPAAAPPPAAAAAPVGASPLAVPAAAAPAAAGAPMPSEEERRRLTADAVRRRLAAAAAANAAAEGGASGGGGSSS